LHLFLKTRWDSSDREFALADWDPALDGELPGTPPGYAPDPLPPARPDLPLRSNHRFLPLPKRASVILPSLNRASRSLHRASHLPRRLFVFRHLLRLLLPRLRRGKCVLICPLLLPARVLPALPSPSNGLSKSLVRLAAINPTTSIAVLRRFHPTPCICLLMFVRS
jgi:hypothetical protein